MKRSEIIDILANQFINRGMCGEPRAPLAANEILAILEQAGMRAPLCSGDIAGYVEDGEWELEQGICPCDADNEKGCSVTGCALACYKGTI